MYFDKEKGVVLTRKTNRLFLEIAVQARVSEENKKGNLLKDCPFGGSVEMTTASSNEIRQDILSIMKY
jgi:hypothetical protein